MDLSDLPKSASTFDCEEFYKLAKVYWLTKCKPRLINFTHQICECADNIYRQLDDCLFPPDNQISNQNKHPPAKPITPNVDIICNKIPYHPPEITRPIQNDVATQTITTTPPNSPVTLPGKPRSKYRKSVVNFSTDGNVVTSRTNQPSESDSESDWERIDCVV
jgi:hypothetical protein